MATLQVNSGTRWLAIRLIAAVASIVPLRTACATTATTTITVTITITAGCQVTASPLGFTAATVLSLAETANTTLVVTCTNTTPYTVSLDAGAGSGATTTIRKMTSASTATISYSLYQNAGLSTNFGNTSGTDTVAGTGNGAAQSITVYGRVPAQTTPAPATYSDIVNVTVTY